MAFSIIFVYFNSRFMGTDGETLFMVIYVMLIKLMLRSFAAAANALSTQAMC